MKNYVMFNSCIKASDEEGMMFSFDSPFSNGYNYCSSNVHSCGGCFAFCAFLSRTVCCCLSSKHARIITPTENSSFIFARNNRLNILMISIVITLWFHLLRNCVLSVLFHTPFHTQQYKCFVSVIYLRVWHPSIYGFCFLTSNDLGIPISISVVFCVVTEMDLVEPPRSIDVEGVCGRKKELTFQIAYDLKELCC